MSERGFHDCKECRGEGIVRRMIPPTPEQRNASRIPRNVAEMTVQQEIITCPACEKRRAAITRFEEEAAGGAPTESIRDLADWLNATMPEGARLMLSDYVWRKLSRPYGSDFARFLGRAAETDLMSNLVGSAWGGWTVERDPIQGHITIARHPCGDKRTYIDPDRAHLFRKVGGELVHVQNIWSAEAVADIARMIVSEPKP